MRARSVVLEKDGIRRLLDALIREAAVVAPVSRRGVVIFDRISSGGEARLDYETTAVSPKQLALPRFETLLSSGADEEGKDVREHFEDPVPVILFGARPCDAAAFRFLDMVFLSGRDRDVYYERRRKSLLIVSLGCGRPMDSCFCASTGGGPFSANGSDVLITDLGDRYVLHQITEEGGALLQAYGLPDAGSEDIAEAERVASRTGETAGPLFDVSALKDRLSVSFDDECWKTLTERCIGCGVCTYVCPTCHCFDIVDEEGVGVRARNRIWDSCQFPGFTLQASGHNPRPTWRERYRQRIMHKFSYCIDSYGAAGCVGCGRCIEACPVNLDIRQVLAFFLRTKGGLSE